MDNVLVTGGTGFTGSYLVESLIKDGFPVRVVARSAEKAKRVLPAAAEVVVGDITDPEIVKQAIKGIDVVYHIVGAFREPGIPDKRYWEVNVDSTMDLLEASRAEGIKRFVHCSTVGVLSHVENPPADETFPYNPGDIYQSTKAEAEKRILEFQRKHDFPVSIGRPAPIYGPGDDRLLKLFRMIANRRFLMLGDGNPFFHMVHVRDLVAGFRLQAERPEAIGEIFIFAGESYCSLREVTHLIADAVGVPRPNFSVPAWPVQLAGSICERVCIPLGITPPIYRRRVDFFTKSRAFSIEKAKTMLGYRPQISLEEGLRETADWAQAEGLIPDRRSLRATATSGSV